MGWGWCWGAPAVLDAALGRCDRVALPAVLGEPLALLLLLPVLLLLLLLQLLLLLLARHEPAAAREPTLVAADVRRAVVLGTGADAPG